MPDERDPPRNVKIVSVDLTQLCRAESQKHQLPKPSRYNDTLVRLMVCMLSRVFLAAVARGGSESFWAQDLLIKEQERKEEKYS